MHGSAALGANLRLRIWQIDRPNAILVNDQLAAFRQIGDCCSKNKVQEATGSLRSLFPPRRSVLHELQGHIDMPNPSHRAEPAHELELNVAHCLVGAGRDQHQLSDRACTKISSGARERIKAAAEERDGEGCYCVIGEKMPLDCAIGHARTMNKVNGPVVVCQPIEQQEKVILKTLLQPKVPLANWKAQSDLTTPPTAVKGRPLSASVGNVDSHRDQ
jgi:hypothetical protein